MLLMGMPREEREGSACDLAFVFHCFAHANIHDVTQKQFVSSSYLTWKLYRYRYVLLYLYLIVSVRVISYCRNRLLDCYLVLLFSSHLESFVVHNIPHTQSFVFCL